MIFLGGLPRAGSTLLGALLSQREDTHVSTTSALCDIIGGAVDKWENHPASKANQEGDGIKLIKAIMDVHYAAYKNPIIIDKSRGWHYPQIIETMHKVQDTVKIIAPVRPMAECFASIVKLVKPEDVSSFCKTSAVGKHFLTSYQSLKEGYKAYPDNFLFIEYDDMIANPQKQLNRISEFLEIDKFIHTFENIDAVREDDEVWRIENLHKVRKTLSKEKFSRKDILGDELWKYYQGGEFWNSKPEPVKKTSILDLQYEALMRGQYEQAKGMCYKNLKKYPECNRTAFNAGWFKLSEGKVKEGYLLLDRGRTETIWGDPHIGSSKPIWRKDQKGTVLLRLERGLGDQIHQARYATDLANRGCTVVVSCSPELAQIIYHVPGVSVVVEHGSELNVFHDFWLPAMSAPVALEYEQENIRGDSYVAKPSINVVRGRIGLRWQGNPLYEHATKRLFPPKLLFDAVKGENCISLQKGAGEEHRPEWVKEVSLDSWVDTVLAIVSCELVITSCTAIAHLAAALGVPTYTVVPLVPYYLWSGNSEKTSYYDSMTLFRQTEVDNWEAPFKKIEERLEMRHAA